MSRKSLIVTGIAAAYLFGMISGAFGQRTTATIFGSVRDATGAIVPGAAIEILNELTGNVISVASNESGEFVASFLPVARYRLKAEHKGFKPFVRSELELASEQQVRLEITLELGQTTDSVTVTAEAPMLQNASATLRDNLTKSQLAELPLPRRDFTNLLNLQDGMKLDKKGMFSINGLADGGGSFTADGINAAGNSEYPSTSNAGNYNLINVMSLEAIQEIDTSRGAFSAEVGSTYSGNINLITKSGTNQFHGSLFENWQNDILNTRNFFSSSRPVTRFNQFGGSLGGPAIRNKLFFFFTYEGYRQSNQAVVSGLVPTPEWRAKAIAAVPAYKTLLDLFPKPSVAYAATADAAQYYGVGANTATENHIVVRGDYQLNSTNLLTARYIEMRPRQRTPNLVDATSVDAGGTNDSGVVTFVHSAHSWTGETRVGMNYNSTSQSSPGISADYASQLPLANVSALWSKITGTHADFSGHTYSMEEVIAKNHGRHTFKFGGIYGARVGGRLSWDNPLYTYSTPADMLANKPSQVQFTFGSPGGYSARIWQLGGFIQDDFRLRPNLVLNLGVRYEYNSVIHEAHDLIQNPGSPGNAESLPTKFRPRDSLYNNDPNNFMPRVGVSWGLGANRKTVIRSGFGMFVAAMPLQGLNNLVTYNDILPYRSVFSSQSDISTFKLLYPVSSPQAIQILSGGTYKPPRGWETWDQNNPAPYSMQWSFDVQRQLTPTLVFQTGYAGNKGLKVTMSHNRNLPDRLTGIAPVPTVLNYVYRDAADNSWYHGWSTSLRKRVGQGLAFNAHYTWSRAMAYSIGDFSFSNNRIVQDDKNIRDDKGPTATDRTHDFRSDVIYQLPVDRWLHASGALRHVAGGWQVSSIFVAQTGLAITPLQPSNIDSSRPDYFGGDPYAHPTDISAPYLNKKAFAQVPVSSLSKETIRPGNAGKSSLRGPNYWNIDLSIGKSFALREKMNLQFRADMFNSLNHTNWDLPVADITKSTFGSITTALPSRSMQLALRLAF